MPDINALRNLSRVIGVDAAGLMGVSVLHNGLGGPARLSVTGDSIMADAKTTGTGWLNWGSIAWMRRFLGDRVELPIERVYAVSGATVADVYNNQFAAARDDVSNIVIDNSGTNSIGTDVATIITQKKTMYNAYRAMGKTVVIIGIRAHRSPSAFTADQKKQVGYINRVFRDYAAQFNDVLFFDPDLPLIDWTTGDVQSQFFRDGIHDNVLSAKINGKRLADQLAPFLPLVERGFVGVGDVYDATLNPSGNILANGLMAGAAGTLSNGATGVAPTGWTAQRSAPASTASLAVSKEADPVYSTLERTVLTLGGTGDGAQLYVTQNVNLPAGIVAGDTLELEALADWALTEQLLSICARNRFRDTGGATLLDLYEGYYTTANGVIPAGDTGSATYKMRTVVPANAVSVQVYLMAVVSTSGAAGGTLKWSRCSLRKVNP